MKKTSLISLAAIALSAALSTSVQADVITYDVTNKSPGGIALPDYGLRLDDLFTAPTNSNWTFSFDDTDGASVQMDVDTDNDTVRIHGLVYGGRDTGSAWDPATAAFWNLDFTYNDGITITDATNGYWTVDYNADNFGFLQLIDAVNADGIGGTDEGKYIALADFHGGSFVANGGPAPAGPFVSAWLESTDGFIASNSDLVNENYVRPNGGACCMDFGFRASEPVPAPMPLILLSLGLFGLGAMNYRARPAK